MNFRKISGPDGYELQLLGVPPHVDVVGCLSLLHPILIKNTIRDAFEVSHRAEDLGLTDCGLLFTTIENLERAVQLMARDDVGALTEEQAREILASPCHESAYRIVRLPRDSNLAEVIRDENAFQLGI